MRIVVCECAVDWIPLHGHKCAHVCLAAMSLPEVFAPFQAAGWMVQTNNECDDVAAELVKMDCAASSILSWLRGPPVEACLGLRLVTAHHARFAA